jgi:hypothetical protein
MWCVWSPPGLKGRFPNSKIRIKIGPSDLLSFACVFPFPGAKALRAVINKAFSLRGAFFSVNPIVLAYGIYQINSILKSSKWIGWLNNRSCLRHYCAWNNCDWIISSSLCTLISCSISQAWKADLYQPSPIGLGFAIHLISARPEGPVSKLKNQDQIRSFRPLVHRWYFLFPRAQLLRAVIKQAFSLRKSHLGVDWNFSGFMDAKPRSGSRMLDLA